MIKIAFSMIKYSLSFPACFVLFEALRPGQQFFQYLAIGMKCLAHAHNTAPPGEYRTCDRVRRSPNCAIGAPFFFPCGCAPVCTTTCLSSAGQKHFNRSVHFLLVHGQIFFFYQRKWDNLPQECAERGSRTRGRLHVV